MMNCFLVSIKVISGLIKNIRNEKVSDLIIAFFTKVFLFAFVFAACRPSSKIAPLTGKAISDVITEMTNLMVHDVTNPPLAARFFLCMFSRL